MAIGLKGYGNLAMPKNTNKKMPDNMLNFIPRGGYDSLLDDMGWDNVVIYPIPSDASKRRYFRIIKDDDESVMLMDAPPEFEDVGPFLKIAKHLKELGFSAPNIIGAIETDGFLLLEDLGENTFTFSLNGGTDEEKLYALAIDALVALHKIDRAKTTPDWLPDYSDEKLLAEAALFPDWYMPAVGIDDLNDNERAEYDAAWLEVLPNAKAETNTLVLRDFHVDNLVLIEDRDNVAACGLLDFQDAVIGHAAYDLMSLLEDARRDINPELKTKMLARYHAALETKDIENFNDAFAILAANRHAKVIGIFTRLFVRDNKPVYLKHIERVWKLLEYSLEHPALAPVNTWFKKYVPVEMRVTPKNLSSNNK